MSVFRSAGHPSVSRPAADPRRLVAMGTLVAVLAIAGATTAVAHVLQAQRDHVDHVRSSISVPQAHLADTLEATSAAETLLQRAVAQTGDERNSLLSQSVAAAARAAEAWTSYRAAALPLDGEAQLAARYERDNAEGQAIVGDIMVPILQSGQPGVLAEEQPLATERIRHDLTAVSALYDAEQATTLRSLDQRLATVAQRLVVGVSLLTVMVLVGAFSAGRIARRVVTERRSRARAAELTDFEARLIRALGLADDDAGAFHVAARAGAEILPGAALSIVASDATSSTLAAVLGQSACGVESRTRCPAIRAGAPLEFSDSEALDACPVLGAAAGSPCAVTCLPISVAGRDVAVVQLTGPIGRPPEPGAAGRVVVRRVGERITMLRAFARSELQASRDPLTGLYNRRSLEAAVEELGGADAPYSVAYADLDHFKRLNDAHGHDAGDQALRGFAQTLLTSLRPEDLACRWGGEEFLVVLPGCDQSHAADAMDRVRCALVSEASEGPDVRVSVGVAEARPGDTFGETVARADDALRRAKSGGRDRVVTSDALPPWAPSASIRLAAGHGR